MKSVALSVLDNKISSFKFLIYQVAKKIYDLKIDKRLKNGDPSLVNDIAHVTISGKEKVFYSFASKYCSHHNNIEFPIYDYFVDRMLMNFKNKSWTVKANTTELFYDGRSIPITINYDYEHDFSMTILNDAQGYLYPAIAEFIMSNATTELANGGYTMTIKVMTGDEKYSGMMITCTGVKLISLGALGYGQS